MYVLKFLPVHVKQHVVSAAAILCSLSVFLIRNNRTAKEEEVNDIKCSLVQDMFLSLEINSEACVPLLLLLRCFCC